MLFAHQGQMQIIGLDFLDPWPSFEKLFGYSVFWPFTVCLKYFICPCDQVGVKALIAAETFKTQDYYAMVHSICPELDTCAPGNLQATR